MTKHFFIGVGILSSVVLLSGCQKATQPELSINPNEISPIGLDQAEQPTENTDSKVNKRYGIPMATIVYTYSGMQTGKEIVVFDRYGQTEFKEAELAMQVGGYSQSTHSVTLYQDGEIVTFDTKDRIGTRIQQPVFLGSGSTPHEWEMGETVLLDMGGIKNGTKEIAGKICDLWELDQFGTTVCIRNGILLESLVGFMGQNQYIVAISLDEGPVDQSLFVIPDDIDFSSSQAAQDMMNQFFDDI